MRQVWKLAITLIGAALLLTACLGPGTYQVSPTLQNGRAAIGLWHTVGGDGCYWERLAGFSGSLDDILANDFSPGGPRYVEVRSGDAGFRTSGCYPWVQAGGPLDHRPVLPSTFTDGDYLVGIEISAGRFQASDPDCYWERVSSFDGDFSSIITNGLSTIVDVSSSDYGLSTSGCGTWTKIG